VFSPQQEVGPAIQSVGLYPTDAELADLNKKVVARLAGLRWFVLRLTHLPKK
jgi:hypothetical protein